MNGAKTYSVGQKLFETACIISETTALPKISRVIMHNVVSECKEACNFAELDGSEALCSHAGGVTETG